MPAVCCLAKWCTIAQQEIKTKTNISQSLESKLQSSPYINKNNDHEEEKRKKKTFSFCTTFVYILIWTAINVNNLNMFRKNPAYGRHRISQPMRIIEPFLFPDLKKKINAERLFVLKALQVGPQMHQSNTSHAWPIHRNNSLFLRLYESVGECTSPLVEHLPHMADPCMHFRTTPCF